MRHRTLRGVLFAFLILLVLVAAMCCQAAPQPAGETQVEPPELLSRGLASAPVAVQTVRPPDSADELGPYPVALQALSGPPVIGVHLVYTVAGGGAGGGDLAMRRAGPRWEAALPGQPAGSEVAYYFRLALAGGRSQRWPADDRAVYRVRIVSLRVVGATLEPGRDGVGGALRVSVAAAVPPTGELELRVHGGEGRAWRITGHLEASAAHAPSGSHTLRFDLPALHPGDAAELHATLYDRNGGAIRVPTDPARAFTLKRPLRTVSAMAPVTAAISDVRSAAGQRWVALAGGGVVREDRDGIARWRGALDGLPSGVARFALPDAASGDAVIGTDQGVVTLGAPAVGAQRGIAVLAGPAAGRPVAAARSPLDGATWIELEPSSAGTAAAARWLEVRDGRALPWLSPDPRLLTLTHLELDDAMGCFVLGALVADPSARAIPALGWRCGAALALLPLAPARIGATAIEPQRILAFARDPDDGAPVIALRYAVPDERRGPGVGFGLFRVRAENGVGALTPLALDVAALPAPITALAADPAHRRLLVATDGAGLFAIRTGGVTSVPGLPPVITAAHSAQGGELLIGAPSGVWALDGDTVIPPVPQPPAVARNALPGDTRDDRILLGSFAAGVIELARDDSGWHESRRFVPGSPLPPGPYGDAVYGSAGELYVAVAGRGIARLARNGDLQLLGAAAGLRRLDILRLLGHADGELWALEAPLPFDGGDSALMMLRDGRVHQSVTLRDRDLATVSRWLQTPGRDTVLAASRAGLLELGGTPFLRVLSPHAARAVATSFDGHTVAAAGDTVERLDDAHLSPVLFRVDRARPTAAPPGALLDAAIARNGTWYALFSGGVLAVLDDHGRALGVLDPDDGIPPSSVRLRLHPASGDLVIGSTEEGPVVLRTE